MQVALLFDAAKNARKRKRGETTAALKKSAGLPESHSSKGTRPRQRNSGRSLASIHEQGEGVGGARRNRTADNGFADHCLTTWRPRHRTKGDLERRRPRRGGAPAVQFPALEQKLTPLCSASCGDRLLLTGTRFIDDGRADEVAPFGPRTVVVTNVTVAQEILQDEPGVRTALTDTAVSDDLVLAGNAFRLVELLQVVEGFEGAVFV